MPRDDYNRFAELVNEFSENFKVINCFNDALHPFNFSKVVIKNTLKIEAHSEKTQRNIEFEIDLFPRDFVESKETYFKISKT